MFRDDGKCKIVLADDHAMLRQGIKKIIEEEDNLEVVGEVSDGLELIEFLNKNRVNLVLLDISMPNVRGIEAITEVRRAQPGVKVLMLTMHNNKEYLYAAISAGADGYLLKENSDDELLAAIDQVMHGETYISSTLAADFSEDLMKFYRKNKKLPFEHLTNREREILKMVAEGNTSREIGDLLYISLRTVEHHRANIMRKMKFRSVADLIKYALDKGYV
ncbi:MAG: response regulator transcription factor [Deltaproteobacteria bacterium]|nr:response regulator transcription factor [Deltaproteobacteria bacterium]